MTHNFSNINSSTHYVSVEILNMTNTTKYNWFEIMTNSTNSIRVYYCNSSYNFASALPGSSNCVNFFTLTTPTGYNHTHTSNSAHQFVPFAINTTTGQLNGIEVTPKSYFVIRGLQTVRYYYIDAVSRVDAMKVSTNNGASWTNLPKTVDAHVHQYDGTDRIYYYVCANDTFANTNCSSLRSDLTDLLGIPPTVSVSNPTNTTFTSSPVYINYTALSPNGYLITKYSIYLLDTDYNTVYTISSDNGVNLGFEFNPTLVSNGDYIVKVNALDNQSQTGSGYSEVFTINNPSTPSTTTTTGGASSSSDGWVSVTQLTNATSTNTTLYSIDVQYDKEWVLNKENVISDYTKANWLQKVQEIDMRLPYA
jgi:hypothetical protein